MEFKIMTVAERHELYKNMFAFANNPEQHWQISGRGLCWLANNFNVNIYNTYENKGAFAALLPELWAKKPANVRTVYWFECCNAKEYGWDKRRELLQQCIEETTAA